MFVSHIAELSDAHLYFTKLISEIFGCFAPPEKKSSYATVRGAEVDLYYIVRWPKRDIVIFLQ